MIFFIKIYINTLSLIFIILLILIKISDTIIIQDAMGEKIGTFIQYMSTGIVGFVLGFTKSWKLSLVMFAVTPLV